MNKLGFYIENTTVKWLRQAIEAVQPPVILIHAQDRGLLQDIRSSLSPDTLIIGRLFKDVGEQQAWLDSGDPASYGRAFAEEILSYDFEMATEIGANGRRLIDAWMSLNEPMRGPAAFPGFQVDDEFRRRAEAYDRFQEAFHNRLAANGVNAVAFNFAAGNFIRPEHYLDWFPRTLGAYTYLGFHEYGWPSLIPEPGVHTAALYYRTCMKGIRARYGDQHRAIITELGLTMAYGDPSRPDEGWLNLTHTLSEEAYWKSLYWYNQELLKDEYALGASLFQVGHSGRWESFRHLGEDNRGNAIQLMNRIQGLGASLFPPTPAPPEPSVPPEEPDNPEQPPVDPDLPPSPADATLEERVNALLIEVDRGIQDLEVMPGQISAIEGLLSRLTTPAEQAVQAGALAQNLRARIDQTQAKLNSLNGNGDNAAAAKRLKDRQAALSAELATLEQSVAKKAAAGANVLDIERKLPGYKNQVNQTTQLSQQLQSLQDDAQALQSDLPSLPSDTPPNVQDVRARMPTHPTKEYPVRSLADIHRIVVHHTVTSPNTAPEVIAQAQIDRRDMPGISYHYLVSGDGVTYWTQSLETVVEQTLQADINKESIGLALAGNFTSDPPQTAQLDAAARLIAMLMRNYGIGIDQVVGRSELEAVSSPGRQWLNGARYKETLIAKVRGQLGI